MINERVTIVLNSIDSVVPIELLLANRIAVAPIDHQAFRPNAQIARREHGAAPTGYIRQVARHHVEIRACEISFEGIDRFKYGVLVARCNAIARFRAVQAGPGGATYFRVRKTASFVVHPAIRGIHMKKVRQHGRCTIEPVLRHSVLSVVAIAFAIVIAALIGAEGERVGSNTIRSIAVDIPHLSIRTHVGGLEMIPELCIALHIVRTDDAIQRAL